MCPPFFLVAGLISVSYHNEFGLVVKEQVRTFSLLIFEVKGGFFWFSDKENFHL
jgi:hypothetical protein